jgi:hypothetical protein
MIDRYNLPIFDQERNIRDAVINVYRGGMITSHMMGFPHPSCDQAMKVGRNRGKVLYRINVKVKTNAETAE